MVVCGSTACADYFAGPSHRNVTLAAGTFVQAGGYVAPRITIVLTSSTWDRNPYVLAHERSHVEVAARLNGKHVPAWFDEGLATYVGGEPQCSSVKGKGIADLTQLDAESDWTAYTADSTKFSTTYCQARGEVAAWIGKNGNGAVGQLLQSVAQGAVFAVAYGPLMTP